MSSSKNVQVQGTNDSSSISKLSAAKKGYFQDEFLHFFVEKPSSRSPLINRGYYIRFKAIEAVFESWFGTVLNLHCTKCQVISLGAGFDSSYFRLKENGKLPRCCTYVEIDFPEMVKRKLSCINANKDLWNLLAENVCDADVLNYEEIVLATADYILLGLDLNESARLNSLFSALKLDFDACTLFLSECSITYMDVKKSDELILWASQKFPNSAFVTYEQVYPDDGFGLIMQNHFRTIGSRLKSVEVYPNPSSQCSRFHKLGWSRCCSIGMNEFFKSLPIEERQRIWNLELFDEYETWHLKCSHYVLMCACQGVVPALFKQNGSFPSEVQCDLPCMIKKDAETCFQRYGHKVVSVGADETLICGGFGVLNGKHQRLKAVVSTDLKNLNSASVFLLDPNNTLGERMYHSMTPISNNRVVVFGGRSAPNKPCSNVLLLCPVEKPSSNNNELQPMPCEINCKKYTCTVVKETDSFKPRWRHSASLVTINGIENIVLFGGSTAVQKATNGGFVLNVETWTSLEIPVTQETPCARHSHSASVSATENEIIIACGLSVEEVPLNTVHAFNPTTFSWKTLAVKGLLPRYSHTSHMRNKKLILIGGVNTVPNRQPYVAVIDLCNMNAVEILMPAQDPDDIILLHGHSSVLNKNRIISIGGGGNCFSFGTHFNKRMLLFDIDKLLSLNCASEY